MTAEVAAASMKAYSEQLFAQVFRVDCNVYTRRRRKILASLCYPRGFSSIAAFEDDGEISGSARDLTPDAPVVFFKKSRI
ncbi:hypothetical protein H6G41_13620 [Tolypothrix sp. FACHB-123]|uniref:hypothetical protein n=1 Tax=Tolypothrix sp. FACHB-123 TaxID=2692868 RepID=UPI001682618A|nr:hypothetical protein [Tolypothrix sp. FACHB-123]MBD2355643.1 hypothetical protein [Tolypothrix sp. FACHB-123]